MPRKRNDVKESAADCEIALTRVTSAWALVLAILFLATTPLPENRAIRFSIQGSLGGDVACTGSEGECTESTERIRTSQAPPQEFDVLRAMAWKAWLDWKQVSPWWWPKRLTTAIDEMEGRTGDVWRLVMHGPDGADCPNESAFTEAVPYERLGYKLSSNKRGLPAPRVEMMATFGEAGKAQLTMRMVFVSAEAAREEEGTRDAWRTAA